MAMAKRISVKTLCADPKKALRDSDEDHVYLGVIFGVLNSVEQVETTYGVSEKFLGEIHAVDPNGEETIAGILYLPSVVEGLLKSAVLGSDGEVEFVLRIGVKASDRGIGYEYTADPVVQPQESSRIAALREKVGDPTQLALPAD